MPAEREDSLASASPAAEAARGAATATKSGARGLPRPSQGGIVVARLQQQPQSIRPDALEPAREISLDRMIARVVRELTDIGNADLRLRAELQVATHFDECGVARDGDAQDAKRRTGALERKQRAWRHRAKGGLPRERRARDQHHAVWHEVGAGPTRAERRIVDIALGARDAQRGHATGVVEALGVQIHPGEASERLDRTVPQAHAVTDLAVHLALDGAVVRARLLGGAGESD